MSVVRRGDAGFRLHYSACGDRPDSRSRPPRTRERARSAAGPPDAPRHGRSASRPNRSAILHRRPRRSFPHRAGDRRAARSNARSSSDDRSGEGDHLLDLDKPPVMSTDSILSQATRPSRRGRRHLSQDTTADGGGNLHLRLLGGTYGSAAAQWSSERIAMAPPADRSVTACSIFLPCDVWIQSRLPNVPITK